MLMTIKGAAKELSLSVIHCRKMIKLGRWPCYRLGAGNRGVRLDVDEIKKIGRRHTESGEDRR